MQSFTNSFYSPQIHYIPVKSMSFKPTSQIVNATDSELSNKKHNIQDHNVQKFTGRKKFSYHTHTLTNKFLNEAMSFAPRTLSCQSMEYCGFNHGPNRRPCR